MPHSIAFNLSLHVADSVATGIGGSFPTPTVANKIMIKMGTKSVNSTPNPDSVSSGKLTKAALLMKDSNPRQQKKHPQNLLGHCLRVATESQDYYIGFNAALPVQANLEQ